MTSPTSSITVSEDGKSITIKNCDIQFNTGFDPSVGVATVTITPHGGLGTLPGVLQGEPGPPPKIAKINLTQVPFGQPLPNPPAVPREIAPGVYEFDISINSGPQGDPGQNLIQSAGDLVGTAVNNATIIWDALNNEFKFQPQTIGKLYGPTTISSVSGSGGQQGQPQVLCTITVPAQSFKWFPVVMGQAVVNGTIHTQVELSANIGSTSGDQVAVGYGVTGLIQQLVALQSTIPVGASGTYGEIESGQQATIVISATQIASTPDSWSISNLQASFVLMVNPVS